MSLLDQIQTDIKNITSNADEFARSALFTAPSSETATVNVIHTKHHLGVDTDGNVINTKNAHIAVSEGLLTALGYPVRIDGEVNLTNHRVDVKDSTGIVKNYIIREFLPDETIGLIVCLLGVYDGSD